MQIKDKTFVVTGGASGLGAAVACAIGARGGNVVIADLNREAGEKIAAHIGDRARFVSTDVCDEDSAGAAFELAVSQFGAVHGLVSCAGIAPAEKILGRSGTHKLNSFAKTVAVNLVGSFNMLRLAVDRMAKNDGSDGERGVIINTASIAAYEGQIGQVAYAASKGGVVAMTLPAARELATHRVRVVTIAPGLMETPMLLGMPAEVQESLTKNVPFPARFGAAAEFASLVLHIIDNQYINGEVIRLDGALRMAAK